MSPRHNDDQTEIDRLEKANQIATVFVSKKHPSDIYRRNLGRPETPAEAHRRYAPILKEAVDALTASEFREFAKSNQGEVVDLLNQYGDRSLAARISKEIPEYEKANTLANKLVSHQYGENKQEERQDCKQLVEMLKKLPSDKFNELAKRHARLDVKLYPLNKKLAKRIYSAAATLGDNKLPEVQDKTGVNHLATVRAKARTLVQEAVGATKKLKPRSAREITLSQRRGPTQTEI